MMLHTRDHERRRRVASSSDDDDDHDLDRGAGHDPDAEAAADTALASLAEHVFRRRPAPRSAAAPVESGSESESYEESEVDGEVDDAQNRAEISSAYNEPAPAKGEPRARAGPDSLPDDQRCEPSSKPEAHSSAVSLPCEGDADARAPHRREFKEPPIPEGGKFRFYMHDSRADDPDEDDSASRAVPLPPRSRADCEWKHDLFDRLQQDARPSGRRQPRGNRQQQQQRSRRRWVPKSSRDPNPLPPSVEASVVEWKTSPSGSVNWKPDGLDSHRPEARRIPEVATSMVGPEPVHESTWSSPEPVKAASELAAVEANPEPSAAAAAAAATVVETDRVPAIAAIDANPNPVAAADSGKVASGTRMNPEAREFCLPAGYSMASEEAEEEAAVVYATDTTDPNALQYWIYDGVGPYDYAYVPGDLDPACAGPIPVPPPYYYMPGSYDDPAAFGAVVDDTRNGTTPAE